MNSEPANRRVHRDFVGGGFDPRSTRLSPAGPVRRRSSAGELRNDSLLGFVRKTNLPDQPWKIARMNKITYVLALGAGLVLSLAFPSARANPIVQTLTPTPMSASLFNSLYTPSTTVLTSNYDFMNTPNAGVVESQVFTGTGAAAGTYAYAYQFGVNNAMDTSIQQPTSVNSASMLFNATPVGTDFTHTGTNTYAYVVSNGQVGGISVPQSGNEQCRPGPRVHRVAAELDHGFADLSIPEPDHQHGPFGGRRLERHRRRHLDPAVHPAVRERAEPRAANALSQGVLANRRQDRASAGARAGHRSGLGRRDRGHRRQPAVPPGKESLNDSVRVINHSPSPPLRRSRGALSFPRIWFRIAGVRAGAIASTWRNNIIHSYEFN